MPGSFRKVNEDRQSQTPIDESLFCTCNRYHEEQLFRSNGKVLNSVILRSGTMYDSMPKQNGIQESPDIFADSLSHTLLATGRYLKSRTHFVQLCLLMMFLIFVSSIFAVLIWALGPRLSDNDIKSTQLEILNPLPDDVQRKLNSLPKQELEFSKLFRNATIIDPTHVLLEDAVKRAMISMGYTLPDFAAESQGGEVVYTPDTNSYYTPIAERWFSLLLFSFERNVVGKPMNLVQPSMKLGHCWAFKGSKGNIIIQLAYMIEVAAISIEHVPAYKTPKNDIASAPKEFIVYGVSGECDKRETELGHFEYSKTGRLLQTFPTSRGVFDRVELSVISNHGSLDYTCVYKFQVHGKQVL